MFILFTSYFDKFKSHVLLVNRLHCIFTISGIFSLYIATKCISKIVLHIYTCQFIKLKQLNLYISYFYHISEIKRTRKILAFVQALMTLKAIFINTSIYEIHKKIGV